METKACRHFLEGRCRHGDDCRYSHAEKPPPAPPAPPAPTAPAFPKPDWGDPESAAAAFALQEMNDSKKRIEKDEWNDYWALGDNFLLSPDGNFVVTWGHVEEGRLSDSPVHKIIQARFVHQLAPPVVKIIKSLHFIQSSTDSCSSASLDRCSSLSSKSPRPSPVVSSRFLRHGSRFTTVWAQATPAAVTRATAELRRSAGIPRSQPRSAGLIPPTRPGKMKSTRFNAAKSPPTVHWISWLGRIIH
ncbi:unnamed protein product [Durusdinium trenchii]|uniref:C3H1-type domain-containing protein n=1 Tax=Durusdinium trenchii TaxID=1381693 RepID=A0ABP0QEB7_9DINO